jgi:hypothetical protein
VQNPWLRKGNPKIFCFVAEAGPDLKAPLSSARIARVSIAKTADDREQRGKDEDENHETDKSMHIPNGT